MSLTEGFGTMHQGRQAVIHSGHSLHNSSKSPLPPFTPTPPTPDRPPKSSSVVESCNISMQRISPGEAPTHDVLTGIADWRSMTNGLGGDGAARNRKWWLG